MPLQLEQSGRNLLVECAVVGNENLQRPGRFGFGRCLIGFVSGGDKLQGVANELGEFGFLDRLDLAMDKAVLPALLHQIDLAGGNEECRNQLAGMGRAREPFNEQGIKRCD